MNAKHLIVFLFMLATLVVLVMGVISMMRGGEGGRQNSNRLMVLRVGLQGATVLLLGVMFLLR